MDLDVSDPAVGRLLDGRYRVQRRLARGGMATVYEALDTRLDRVVALKVMHPGLAEDHDFVQRFIGEARSAARLSHPHVVAVYDQGEDAGVVYLAMEHVAGRTLRAVLREDGPLPPAVALEVLEQVLGALAAAHAAGIVHRDVKPENVLLGDDGRIKVADFGLARAVAQGSTATRGVLLGTVAYISPEQALGEAATPRSDVYSAGILLWELLTGEVPHDGPTDYVIVRQHIEADVPPPSWTAPAVPAVVDDLVLQAVSRDPRERYADAGAFLGAVRRARRTLAGGAQDGAGADSTALLARQGPVAGDDPHAADARTAVIGRTTDRQPVPEPPPRRRRRSRKGPVAFLLVLLLAIGVAAGAWWLGAGRWVSTPSMLGVEAAVAQARAEAAGLTTEEAGERRFSETVPAGIVLETDPAPGEQVLRGGVVTLVLSAGPERYEVPAVVGRQRAEAEAALTQAGLLTGEVEERYDEETAEGVVLEQGVAAGEQVKPDTAVPLVVSLGREPLEIASFVGQDAGEARTALEETGFSVSAEEAYDDEVPEGAVISQSPAEGTGFRGDAVALVVSLGPETVEVPRLERGSYEEAAAALEELGLTARRVELLPAGPGTVLRQTPRAGTEVRRGSEVTLYVF